MLLENDRGRCPACKQGTAFIRVHEVHYASPKYAGPTTTFNRDLEDEARTGVLIYRCLHCEASIILLEHETRDRDQLLERHVWREMVAPKQEPRTLSDAVPEAIRGLYVEASQCEFAQAMRGAGVLYRAAVEELVKDQGAEGPNLYKKIESLRDKLGSELVDDLHEARMLGNDSIHAALTYSAEEVADVAQLIDEAVLVLYVQPAQKQAMREARQQRRTSGEAKAEP